jgi:hypothetical protein
MGAASSSPESNAKAHGWTRNNASIESDEEDSLCFPMFALFLSCRVCGLLKFENP